MIYLNPAYIFCEKLILTNLLAYSLEWIFWEGKIAFACSLSKTPKNPQSIMSL